MVKTCLCRSDCDCTSVDEPHKSLRSLTLMPSNLQRFWQCTDYKNTFHLPSKLRTDFTSILIVLPGAWNSDVKSLQQILKPSSLADLFEELRVSCFTSCSRTTSQAAEITPSQWAQCRSHTKVGRRCVQNPIKMKKKKKKRNAGKWESTRSVRCFFFFF